MFLMEELEKLVSEKLQQLSGNDAILLTILGKRMSSLERSKDDLQRLFERFAEEQDLIYSRMEQILGASKSVK